MTSSLGPARFGNLDKKESRTMANLQIMTMSLRAASQKGKSINVDGQAKPENLPVFHWETKASGNITLAAHRGLKKSADGNLVTFTAKKDMTVKAGG